jgi:hypothetical protein
VRQASPTKPSHAVQKGQAFHVAVCQSNTAACVSYAALCKPQTALWTVCIHASMQLQGGPSRQHVWRSHKVLTWQRFSQAQGECTSAKWQGHGAHGCSKQRRLLLGWKLRVILTGSSLHGTPHVIQNKHRGVLATACDKYRVVLLFSVQPQALQEDTGTCHAGW